MKKHAYLIMAHNQPDLLKKLVALLDDERNDIYIHADIKMNNFQENEYREIIKRANILFTERTNIKWGSYSQIHCELLLLKEAVKREHRYYHLLSGVDLPIKPQNVIHEFFERYDGLEFVDEDNETINEKCLERIKYYHILNYRKNRLSELLKNSSMAFQHKLGVNRLEAYKDVRFQKGRNWFSITHEFAKYVIGKEKWLEQLFEKSFCADELFLQTLARNSKFEAKICNSITMPEIPDTRHIDWTRGYPYVFQDGDYEELKSVEALFARKFDLNVDQNIIERIYADMLNS